MAHGVIRTDLMTGTDVGYDLVSVKYVEVGDDADTALAIDNGNVVKLDSLYYEDQREVWKGVEPAANTAIEDIAIIASVEMMYDEKYVAELDWDPTLLDAFYNKAGKICRAYRPHGIYSATADAFTIAEDYTPEVGDVVELVADVKPAIVASLTSGSTQLGTIIGIDETSRYKYYVVQCK